MITFVPSVTLLAQALIDPGIHKAGEEAAQSVLENAERLVPVDTGETKASLHLEPGEKNGTKVVVGGAWLFLEYGTVNMAAHPFLRPALTATGLKVT